MTSRYEAYLDGIALSSVVPTIYIHDIDVQTPKLSTTRYNRGLSDGSLLVKKRIDSTTIRIAFEIRSYDIEQYQKDVARVARWASGYRYLTLNDRPGKRLYVTCTSPLTIDSMQRWTEVLYLTFESVSFPYWEDEDEERNTVTLTGTENDRGSNDFVVKAGILPTGDSLVDPYVEVVATVTGSTVNYLNLAADGTMLSFAGLGLTQGQQLVVYYDHLHIQHITAAGSSALSKRVYTSDDDLKLMVGAENIVSFSADNPMTVQFLIRELSL